MDKKNNMNIDQGGEISPQEQAARLERDNKISDQIKAKALPGRSFGEDKNFSEKMEKLKSGHRTEIQRELGRPGGEIVTDGAGNTLYEQGTYYKKEPDGLGKDRETDEIGAMSEKLYDIQKVDYMARATQQTVYGRDLDTMHTYEAAQTIDPNEKNGKYRMLLEKGQVTDGLDKGTHWESKVENKESEKFKKRIRTNSGEHFLKDENNKDVIDANGQRVFGKFSSEKVNIEHPDFVVKDDPNGRNNPDGCALYYSIEKDENDQERPEKFQFSLADNLPADFPYPELVQLIQEKRQAKEQAIAAKEAAKAAAAEKE
jgi:hypothetical protein